MIRYKKRKYQGGGQSPARDYSAGAAAFQASNVAGASGSLQTAPSPPIEVPTEGTGKSGKARSGIGKSLLSNAANLGQLTSAELPNLAAKYRRELKELREELLSRPYEYYNTNLGKKEINKYKDAYYAYKDTLAGLTAKRKKLAPAALKKGNQIALSGEGNVYVKNYKDNKIEVVTLEEYAADRQADEKIYSTALTMMDVYTYMDDTVEQEKFGTIENYTSIIEQTITNVSDNKKANAALKKPFEGMSLNGEAVSYNDISFTKEFDYDNDNVLKLVEAKNSESPEIRKMYMQEMASDSQFLKGLSNSDNSTVYIEKEIKKRIWDDMMLNLEAPKETEEQKAARKANEKAGSEFNKEVAAYVASDKYTVAQVGYAGDGVKADFDSVLAAYDEDGNKVPEQTDTVLTTYTRLVEGSGEELRAEYFKKLKEAGDEADIIKKSAGLQSFKVLTDISKPSKAVLLDGTPAAKFLSDNGIKGEKRYLPILGNSNNLTFVTLINVGDKLATWAPKLISEVSKEYRKLKVEADKEAKEVMENKSSLALFDENADGKIDEVEIAAYVDKQMISAYDEIVKPFLNDGNYIDGMPTSYKEFMDTQYSYKGYWMLDVLFNVGSSAAEDLPQSKFLTTEGIEDEKDAANKAYDFDNNGDWAFTRSVKTTLLLPENEMQAGRQASNPKFAVEVGRIIRENKTFDVQKLLQARDVIGEAIFNKQ